MGWAWNCSEDLACRRRAECLGGCRRPAEVARVLEPSSAGSTTQSGWETWCNVYLFAKCRRDARLWLGLWLLLTSVSYVCCVSFLSGMQCVRTCPCLRRITRCLIRALFRAVQVPARHKAAALLWGDRLQAGGQPTFLRDYEANVLLPKRCPTALG